MRCSLFRMEKCQSNQSEFPPSSTPWSAPLSKKLILRSSKCPRQCLMMPVEAPRLDLTLHVFVLYQITFDPAPGIPTSPLASRDPKLLLAAERTPFEGQIVPTQVSFDIPRFPGPAEADDVAAPPRHLLPASASSKEPFPQLSHFS